MADRDTITINAPTEFKKWQAPNFATIAEAPRPKQEGWHALSSVPVAQLSPGALDALALAWLQDLYTKAGRAVPRIIWTEAGDNG